MFLGWPGDLHSVVGCGSSFAVSRSRSAGWGFLETLLPGRAAFWPLLPIVSGLSPSHFFSQCLAQISISFVLLFFCAHLGHRVVGCARRFDANGQRRLRLRQPPTLTIYDLLVDDAYSGSWPTERSSSLDDGNKNGTHPAGSGGASARLCRVPPIASRCESRFQIPVLSCSGCCSDF